MTTPQIDALPDELAESFWRYERAVVENDLTVLDEMFAEGGAPMRADAAGLLVGHATISRFRSARGGVAERRIVALEPRRLSPTAWVISAVSEYTEGGTGVQTQVWTSTEPGWRILAAHVSPRSAAAGAAAERPADAASSPPTHGVTDAGPATAASLDHPGPRRARPHPGPLARVLAALRSDPARVQLAMMLALTFSTGVVDAVGYLGLDRVFTANMTGNVVILGMALMGADRLPVVGPTVALLGFALGAAIAGRSLRGRATGWTMPTTAVLGGVTALLAVMSVVTTVMPTPQGPALAAVTAVLAVSMGMQAAAARHIAVKDVTTVVVTSTLTGLAADSVFGAKATAHPWPRRLGAIALIGAGAALGAATLHIGLWFGIAVSALITLVVTVVGHLAHPAADGGDR